MTGLTPYPTGLAASCAPPLQLDPNLSAQQLQQLLSGLGGSTALHGAGAQMVLQPHAACGQLSNPGLDALLQQLSNNGQSGSMGLPFPAAPVLPPAAAAVPARAAGSRQTRAVSDTRPATSYNARHQQAEARRRSRINERLEALRLLVPHTERANTANFLEEVVTYVQRLQGRMVDLERQLGLPASVQVHTKPIAFAADDTPEQTVQRNDRVATQSLLLQPPAQQASMPLSVHQGQQQQQQHSDMSVQAAITLLQQHAQQQQVHLLLQQHQQQLQAQQPHLVPPIHQHFAPNQQHPTANQPPPPQQQQRSQPSQQLQSTGSRPVMNSGDSGDGQSAGLQALAAADSMGGFTVSADGGSLRSTSIPSKIQLAEEALPPPPLKPPEKEQHQVHGIPTDEELDLLHEELSAQDTKKRRLLTT